MSTDLQHYWVCSPWQGLWGGSAFQGAGQWVRWEKLFPVCVSPLNTGLVKTCPFQWWQECRRDGQSEKFKKGWATVQFSSVQSLSGVRLFATPWTAACQAFLAITNSQSAPKPTSSESVMSSSHLQLTVLIYKSWLFYLSRLWVVVVLWLFKNSHYREG